MKNIRVHKRFYFFETRNTYFHLDVHPCVWKPFVLKYRTVWFEEAGLTIKPDDYAPNLPISLCNRRSHVEPGLL